MKLKIILKLFSLLIWIGYSNAQETIASGGQYYDNSGYSNVFTVGEPVIESLVNNQNILTQGFNQSKLLVTALDEQSFAGIHLKVYPNPATTCLHLNISQPGDVKFMYRLIDTNGNLLSTEKIQSENEKIEMQSYTAGNYLLYITDVNGVPVQTFKIVKNQ